jgi:hypothetical protein
MRTEKTLPSPFRAGAIPDIMTHCLHHKIQVVTLSHTSENFLPMEKGRRPSNGAWKTIRESKTTGKEATIKDNEERSLP